MFFPIFLRSFFIQAGWNYEKFQNLGFAFAMLPALKRIYPPGGKLNAAVKRHLGIFNTQPYMAGFVLGNMTKIEEEAGPDGPSEAVEKKMLEVKAALAAGFAAIGDRFFWGRLKPMTTQLCIAVWLLAGFHGWLFPLDDYAPPLAFVFAGPLAGLAVYGAAAVYLRWAGLKKGYECGGRSSCGLDAVDWPGAIRSLSRAGFALSLLIAVSAAWLLADRGLAGASKGLAADAALVLGVLAVQRASRRSGRSIFFAMGLILAASVALVMFFPEGSGAIL
jgi:mannose/fructose/N-acetylgalactosamine-specific phosphotransferase system component IID